MNVRWKSTSRNLLARALVVWWILLALAVLNGAIREAWIAPRTGDAAAHGISSLMLCVLILILTRLAIGWLRPSTARDAWTIGGTWVGLTVAFEFLAGHYLFGTPWNRLLEDYNLARGRIWVLVLLTTAAAPWLASNGLPLLFQRLDADRGDRA